MAKSNLNRDVITGFFLTAGIFGFISGEFIISTLLLGVASICSNLDLGGSIRA
jgi:hypothetical protein